MDGKFGTLASVESGARGRRVYGITPVGEAQFRAWMRGPLVGADAETESLARTYFLGLMPVAEHLAVLDAIIARGEGDLERLRLLAVHLDGTPVPVDLEPIFRHQRATLDYGIQGHERALHWFRDYRAEVIREPGPETREDG